MTLVSCSPHKHHGPLRCCFFLFSQYGIHDSYSYRTYLPNRHRRHNVSNSLFSLVMLRGLSKSMTSPNQKSCIDMQKLKKMKLRKLRSTMHHELFSQFRRTEIMKEEEVRINGHQKVPFLSGGENDSLCHFVYFPSVCRVVWWMFSFSEKPSSHCHSSCLGSNVMLCFNPLYTTSSTSKPCNKTSTCM